MACITRNHVSDRLLSADPKVLSVDLVTIGHNVGLVTPSNDSRPSTRTPVTLTDLLAVRDRLSVPHVEDSCFLCKAQGNHTSMLRIYTHCLCLSLFVSLHNCEGIVDGLAVQLKLTEMSNADISSRLRCIQQLAFSGEPSMTQG